MKIAIAAVARLKPSPETTLINDYLDRAARLGMQLGVPSVDLKEVEEKKPLSGEELKKREAELLLNAVPKNGVLVALDERGKTMSSRDFSSLIADFRDQGHGSLSFLLGGADGLHSDLRKQAHRTISFGSMTWPHALARVLLCEQIYRAFTIMGNHPYHRD